MDETREPGREPSNRREAIRRVVEEALARRDRGEVLPDSEVIAAHADLMPELADALHVAREIRFAQRTALTAGPLEPTLDPLSDSQLEIPIDLTAVPSELSPPVPRPVIRGYTMLHEISRGGQATVFKAIQQATGRRVALKVFPGVPHANVRSNSRFKREVAILAELNHPYIVGIVDRGVTIDGSLFLAMDYIEGQTLDALAGAMTTEAAANPRPLLRLFVTIAQAVQAAHARGIVHRDLNPANIRIDSRGEPHVLDFGLARIAGAPLAATLSDISPTLAGQRVGALPWASPEQAEGQGELDARTDVYALGVMLYQLLTGRFPYPVSGTVRQVIKNIRRTKPRKPNAVVGPEKWGNLGPALDAVILKALAKSPKKRYPSAGALAAELERCLAGKMPQSQRDADSRWRIRLWLAAGGMALIVMAAASYTYLAWHQHGRASYRAHPVAAFEPSLIVNSCGMQLVEIPPGTLRLAAGKVTVQKWFYMGMTEVTQRQFEAVMGVNPSRPDWLGPDLAVNGVSWRNAVEFCRRLSQPEKAVYHLPTEGEWAYACRDGEMGSLSADEMWRFPVGDMGWYQPNSGGRPHPVTWKRSNYWGLYDMHGGVWEWCIDPAEDNRAAHLEVGRHVLRGGSFLCPPQRCGADSRLVTDSVPPDAGFRVVREVKGKQ